MALVFTLDEILAVTDDGGLQQAIRAGNAPDPWQRAAAGEPLADIVRALGASLEAAVRSRISEALASAEAKAEALDLAEGSSDFRTWSRSQDSRAAAAGDPEALRAALRDDVAFILSSLGG